MKKRFLSFVIALFILISMTPMAFASVQWDAYVSDTLLVNDTLLSSTSTYSINSQNVVLDEVFISINTNRTLASVSFEYEGIQYDVDLIGEATLVENNYIAGYVGVYEGVLVTEDEGSILVIADIIFNNAEIFTALTFGTVSAYSQPYVFFFGDLSSELAAVSNAYSALSISDSYSIQEVYESEPTLYSMNVVDTVPRLQAQVEIVGGDNDEYSLGYVSVFHQNELSNGDEATVKVKVNTNTTEALNYVREVLGYQYVNMNAYSALADKFYITVSSISNSLFIENNSETPESGETSIEFIVPYVTVASTGSPMLGSTSITVPVSSTTTSFSGLTDAQDYTSITWNLESTFGFSESLYNGDATTQNGMVTRVNFKYSTNTIPTLTTRFVTDVSIRYKYWVDTAGGVVTLHFHTGTFTKRTSITCYSE